MDPQSKEFADTAIIYSHHRTCTAQPFISQLIHRDEQAHGTQTHFYQEPHIRRRQQAHQHGERHPCCRSVKFLVCHVICSHVITGNQISRCISSRIKHDTREVAFHLK